MIETKYLMIGPALVASIALSSAVDRSTNDPLFAPRPVAANVAVVAGLDPATGAQTRSAEEMRFNRSADGLFYVHAVLNGVPVRFVLDTGATMVVLTPLDAKRIGLITKTGVSTDSMETAGGRSAIQRVTIRRVKIAGHAVEDVDAAVVDTGLKTSLLGQNLLSQLGPITLSADTAELR